MLARCARMRPCLARFSRESSARSTESLSPSTLNEIPAGMILASSPLGPLTPTLPFLLLTVTPLGSGSTFLPIRDMFLPNLAKELAAEACLARRPIGHQAARGGQDGDPEPGADLGDRAVTDVHALAGARTAPQAGDGVGARVGPTQAHDDVGHALFVAHVDARDVALGDQQLGDALLELGRRGDHLGVARHDGVADTGQEVSDGISH